MLDLQMLKTMPPGTIFAQGGFVKNKHKFKWIAKRGGGYRDWCIYAHNWKGMDNDFISRHGDKICSEDKIKKFVPCTPGAFEVYRY